MEEVFELQFARDAEKRMAQWATFMDTKEFLIKKRTKKGGMKEMNIRPIIKELSEHENGLTIVFDWRELYMSPLALSMAVMEGITQLDFTLTTLAESMLCSTQAPILLLPRTPRND